jgi:hypothetical protein
MRVYFACISYSYRQESENDPLEPHVPSVPWTQYLYVNDTPAFMTKSVMRFASSPAVNLDSKRWICWCWWRRRWRKVKVMSALPALFSWFVIQEKDRKHVGRGRTHSEMTIERDFRGHECSSRRQVLQRLQYWGRDSSQEKRLEGKSPWNSWVWVKLITRTARRRRH